MQLLRYWPIGHGSLLKLRQFHLPLICLSILPAANEYMYQHCWEGTCDGLASRPGESVILSVLPRIEKGHGAA